MKTPNQILDGMKITKIVATRSIKTPVGDTYTGFTASWDTIQDDDPMGDPPSQPLTMAEARIAQLLLAKETDIAAYRSAISNGSVAPIEGTTIIRTIERRYTELIQLIYKENL